MTINKTQEDKKLVFSLEGRLDTSTAPEFESEIDNLPGDVNELVLDFEKLEYISSAGLRIVLKAQKLMNTKGSMKLIKVSDDIMEIFDITGFIDILTIE